MRRALAPVLLALAVHPARADEGQHVVVTVPVEGASFSGLLSANAKGYFRDEGLDVEIMDAGGGVATPALIAGSVNFSSSPASSLSAILRGAPLKIVLVDSDRPDYKLWSTDPQVTSLAGLEGKLLAIETRGDTMEISSRMLLRQHHLSPDYWGYTALGAGAARLAAVQSGAQHFALLMKVDEAQLAPSRVLSNGHVVANLTEEVHLASGGLVVNAREIAEHRDRTKRFLRGLRKGHRYMLAFPDDALAIVKARVPTATDAGLKIDLASYLARYNKSGTMPLDSAANEIAVRGELMNVPAANVPAADKVYDFSLVREVDAALDAEGWTPTR